MAKKKFTGNRFVSKVSDVCVVDWDDNGEEIEGKMWGVWDKQEEAFVHRDGIIVDGTDRAEALDLSKYLNEQGYHEDYYAGK